MLILSRKVHEQIIIGSDIQVTVLRVTGARVQLGLDAPNSVSIRRMELPLLHQSPVAVAEEAVDDARRE